MSNLSVCHQLDAIVEANVLLDRKDQVEVFLMLRDSGGHWQTGDEFKKIDENLYSFYCPEYRMTIYIDKADVLLVGTRAPYKPHYQPGG